MKNLLRVSGLGLALFALTTPAHAWGLDGFPYKVETGANVYFRVTKYPQQNQQLGPWYLYWPLESHFQMQAPSAAPNYPRPLTLPPNFYAPQPQPYPQFQPPQPQQLPPFIPPAPNPLPGNGR